MLFGGALVTEPGHSLLGARAFGYVSGGFGFGGGAGAAPKQRAGHNKGGDEEDKETKPKCHGSHCHLGYPGFCFYLFFCSIRFSAVSLSDLPSVRCTGQKIKGSQPDGKDRQLTLDAKI
jgi:hypothetical protein